MQLILVSTSSADQRTVLFHLVNGTDGITPVTTEAGGQPQYTLNGSAFANTSATLTAIGNGMYICTLTQAEVGQLGVGGIRYKSANTAEFQHIYQVVDFDPFSRLGLGLNYLDTYISSRLAPTVGARTLDVTATGEAGLDWANIGGPTSTQTLSGTTINTTTNSQNNYIVASVTRAIGVDLSLTQNATATLNLTNTTVNTVTTIGTAPFSSAGIGVDWSKLGNQTGGATLTNTTVNSVTNVATAYRVASVTQGITVSTNNDKTGYSIGVGGIDSTSFAASAINSATLAQSAGQEIADEVLDRNLAQGGSSNTRNVQNALRALRNKVSESGGTLTVTTEDDATTAWTAAVTRTASTDPITTVDPT